MAYVKKHWEDQDVERQKTYEFEKNDDGSTKLIESFGEVKNLGTPVNAENMNRIEEGIAGCGIRKYNPEEKFELGEWVLGVLDGKKIIFESLKDENKGNNLENSEFWTAVDFNNSGGSNLFDLIQKDHILSFEEKEGLERLGEFVYKEAQDGRYGYSDFYQKCIEEYSEAVENQDEIEGITIKIHSNGHKFYDIKDKEKVDKIYQDTGVAWYYGIDTAKERILLPRFDEISFSKKSILPVNGDGLCFGLTDGENYGSIADRKAFNSYVNIDLTYTNKDLYGKPVGTVPQQDGVISLTKGFGVTEEPDKSGLIVNLANIKNSNTDICYTYMVVGNIAVKKAIGEYMEVATSENDTIPLFTGQYFDFKPNHASWVKADTEVSGEIYQSAYSELLSIANGEETKYGEGFKVIKEADKLPDTDYSQYWTVNEGTQTFKTPSKISYLPYNPDKNTIPVVGNGKALGLYTQISPAAPIKQWGLTAFSGGYGSYTSTSADTNRDVNNANIANSPFVEGGPYFCGVTKDPEISGLIADLSVIISKDTELYFKVGNAVQNVELIDCGEVLEELNNKISKTECKAYIIQTYTNGTSGYRIWSDGYCEQWGRLAANSDTIYTVNLLKEMRDTNYLCLNSRGVVGYFSSANYGRHDDEPFNFTTKSFDVYGHPDAGLNTVQWEVKGYIKEGE